MKLAIENASQFRDEFRQCGRADQFSYEALGLLFDYFEEIDPDYDLDVIAICCEYSEESDEQLIESYGLNEDADRDVVLAYLNDRTSVVGVTPSGIVYAQF